METPTNLSPGQTPTQSPAVSRRNSVDSDEGIVIEMDDLTQTVGEVNQQVPSHFPPTLDGADSPPINNRQVTDLDRAQERDAQQQGGSKTKLYAAAGVCTVLGFVCLVATPFTFGASAFASGFLLYAAMHMYTEVNLKEYDQSQQLQVMNQQLHHFKTKSDLYESKDKLEIEKNELEEQLVVENNKQEDLKDPDAITKLTSDIASKQKEIDKIKDELTKLQTRSENTDENKIEDEKKIDEEETKPKVEEPVVQEPTIEDWDPEGKPEIKVPNAKAQPKQQHFGADNLFSDEESGNEGKPEAKDPKATKPQDETKPSEPPKDASLSKILGDHTTSDWKSLMSDDDDI